MTFGGRDIDCHYGDHYWLDNGYCDNCGEFNGGLLQLGRLEKANREGRGHYGHFHLTTAAKAACRRGPDPEWVEAYGESEVPASAASPRPTRRLDFLILTMPDREIVSLSLREGIDFLDEDWPEFGDFYVLETA